MEPDNREPDHSPSGLEYPPTTNPLQGSPAGEAGRRTAPKRHHVVIEHGHATAEHRLRLLHTSDWQLGMTRWFLEQDGSDSQALFTEARFAAIEDIAALAAEQHCDAVVVAGDVFETAQVSERHRARFLEAVRHFTVSSGATGVTGASGNSVPGVPVFFLPGNHDPYRVGSVWKSELAQDLAELGATVLTDNSPHEVAGAQIIGAPLTSNTAPADLVNQALAEVDPADGIRVLVGHGQAESRSSERKIGDIDAQAVDKALLEHRVDYVAMGDTHSTGKIDELGGMWFSGAPVVTNFDDRERDSGNVLVVDIFLHDGVTELELTEIPVGTWKFCAVDAAITSNEDIDDFCARLRGIPNPSRTVVKYSLTGQVSFTEYLRIQREIDGFKSSFAAFIARERTMDLVVVPDSMDIANLELSGYLAQASQELAANNDIDALALLIRLVGDK